MTLAQRNRCFKTGIFFASSCFLVILALGGRLLPLYPPLCDAALHRSWGIFQNLAARFFQPVPHAAFATAAASVLYALSASILVFVYFEKTQTPEILFFGLFAQSLAFETIRILVPLRDLYPFPGMLLIFGTRVLIFGRLFGIVSLFASSVYAAGLDFQKQGRVILAMVIAILVVSLKVPVNGLAWDTSYTMIFAYSSMFRFAENILLGITVASFLVAAHVRGTGDYLFIALGALLVSAGRSMLISADTWVTPLPALLVLGAGTWLVMVRLHRVYLWL